MSDIRISEATRISEQNALLGFLQQRSLVLAQLVVESSQELEALRARVVEFEKTQKLDREEIENLRAELKEKGAK